MVDVVETLYRNKITRFDTLKNVELILAALNLPVWMYMAHRTSEQIMRTPLSPEVKTVLALLLTCSFALPSSFCALAALNNTLKKAQHEHRLDEFHQQLDELLQHNSPKVYQLTKRLIDELT
jgi:hypothetical protein